MYYNCSIIRDLQFWATEWWDWVLVIRLGFDNEEWKE